MSMPRRILLVLSTLVVASPAVEAQDEWTWPEKSENLQVLPADFPANRLRSVMTGFSRALGVRCSHCHVGEPDAPLSTYDFASDDNPKKDTARVMLDMLGSINEHLDQVERGGEERVNLWCHTCHRGAPKPARLREDLLWTYEKEGVDATVARYRELRERHHGRGTFDFGEGTLNTLGYQLLHRGDHAAAIAIFRLNVEHFADSANAYDSLAEAYAASGQDELAVAFYGRSLVANPDNENAVKKLGELRARMAPARAEADEDTKQKKRRKKR